MKKFMFAVVLTFALAAGAVGTVTLMTVNPQPALTDCTGVCSLS
jgi:hypothetical protein